LRRLVDRLGACVQVPPAASAAKHAHQVRNGEAATTRWGGRRRQHRQRLRACQLGQGGQRSRVELPQRAAELVGEPLTSPDQALVAAGQNLDRPGKLTVARDPAVLVPIGADQVSQHPGITSIGLGASLAMAVTVAVDRSRLTA
jgi:hypothetical protein